MKVPSKLSDMKAHKEVTICFKDDSFQFSCYVILQMIKPHGANHHSKDYKHYRLYTTGVKKEGRREMKVNERDIWEDDSKVKLCRAQQSCGKRGKSCWVLD